MKNSNSLVILFDVMLTLYGFTVFGFPNGVTNVVTNAKGVTNSFTRGGVSFARRGALTSSDFVVTNAQTVTEGRVAEISTNAARAVVNTVWDSELGVAWEARMHNGALYYVAVTNQPPEVVK